MTIAHKAPLRCARGLVWFMSVATAVNGARLRVTRGE